MGRSFLKNDLRFKFDHIPARVILAQILIFTCSICYYLVFNGIVAEERNVVDSIRPGHQIILAQSDNRRHNVFYSTPEFYFALKNSMPSISVLMEVEAPIEYEVKEAAGIKRLKRSVNAVLVDDNFFEMIQGSLLSGEVITKNDIQSGRPVAIMTQGLYHDLYAEEGHGQEIAINGTSFLVKGTWALGSKKMKENFSLILPISAIKILGTADQTYINRFILKGKGSRELEQLKSAIDSIQLNAGYTPVRPEYSILNIKMSERFLGIVNNQKVYWDVGLWALSIAAAVFFFIDFRSRFYTFNDWIQFRIMCRHSNAQIARELHLGPGLLLGIVVGVSLILSTIIIALLYSIFKTPIAFGTHLHFGIVFVLVMNGFLYFEITRVVEKYRFRFNQNS